VNQEFATKKAGHNTEALETEIDALCGLTEEEKAVVDNSVAGGRG
jgi:hypothetical protein